MTTDFLKLLELLHDNNVEFIIVGGLAAVAYGSSMVTQDLDICINLSPTNWDRLKKAVDDLSPMHRIGNKNMPFTESGSTLHSFKNLYLSTDYGQLDCLGNIKGIGSYSEVFRESVNIELDDKKYRFITLPALIKAKEAMGRPKDKEAILILATLMENDN